MPGGLSFPFSRVHKWADAVDVEDSAGLGLVSYANEQNSASDGSDTDSDSSQFSDEKVEGRNKDRVVSPRGETACPASENLAAVGPNGSVSDDHTSGSGPLTKEKDSVEVSGQLQSAAERLQSAPEGGSGNVVVPASGSEVTDVSEEGKKGCIGACVFEGGGYWQKPGAKGWSE